jgi:hypothetical protein
MYRTIYSEWSPGSHTVNGHVEKLARPDDGEEPIDALKDGHHHLVLVLPEINPVSEFKKILNTVSVGGSPCTVYGYTAKGKKRVTENQRCGSGSGGSVINWPRRSRSVIQDYGSADLDPKNKFSDSTLRKPKESTLGAGLSSG